MRYASLALGIALAACRGATDVDVPLDITLTLDRTVIAANSPAAVTISIVNRGTADIEVPDPRSYSCFPPYAVFEDDGAAVTLPGRSCFTVAYANIRIGPGASMTLVDRWAGERSDGLIEPSTVDPGRYTIAAHILVNREWRTSQPTTVQVR